MKTNTLYRVGAGSKGNPARWTIRALAIHGQTGEGIEYCDLPSPKNLLDEGVSLTGKRYLVVDGYRYEVVDDDWQTLKNEQRAEKNRSLEG